MSVNLEKYYFAPFTGIIVVISCKLFYINYLGGAEEQIIRLLGPFSLYNDVTIIRNFPGYPK
jgi:hypothetical protein